MNDSNPPLIHTLLTRIIGELPAIGKDSKVSGNYGYNYRGIEDMMPSIKTQFAKHSVHMAPSHSVVSDEYGLGKNGNQRRVVLHSTFTFYAPDGSNVVTATIGEAMDMQDKAFNKAMTAALKYALIQTLAIADGDDPDAYQPNGNGATPATNPQPEPQAPAPTPAPPSAATEPSESWARLADLGPRLKDAGIGQTVKDWAHSNGFNLADKGSDVTAVVTFAKELLAGSQLDEPAEGEIVEG